MMNKQYDLCKSLETECQKSKTRLFTEQEDALIRHCYEDLNIKNWKIISTYLENRTSKNCRDRYQNYLDPKIINKPFNLEEEDLLIELVAKYGKKWNAIASQMNNRSPGSVKNKWYKNLKAKVGREFIESIPKKAENLIARLVHPEIQPKEPVDCFWMNDDNILMHSDWLEQIL
jgi:hypothetical protein